MNANQADRELFLQIDLICKKYGAKLEHDEGVFCYADFYDFFEECESLLRYKGRNIPGEIIKAFVESMEPFTLEVREFKRKEAQE